MKIYNIKIKNYNNNDCKKLQIIDNIIMGILVCPFNN